MTLEDSDGRSFAAVNIQINTVLLLLLLLLPLLPLLLLLLLLKIITITLPILLLLLLLIMIIIKSSDGRSFRRIMQIGIVILLKIHPPPKPNPSQIHSNKIYLAQYLVFFVV